MKTDTPAEEESTLCDFILRVFMARRFSIIRRALPFAVHSESETNKEVKRAWLRLS